jgi:hypothetical protein
MARTEAQKAARNRQRQRRKERKRDSKFAGEITHEVGWHTSTRAHLRDIRN